MSNLKSTSIVISSVKEDKKYKGAYARIFRILNAESIFVERYETEESVGFKNGTYFLEIEGTIDSVEYDKISKIKNVKIA
jgi:hypothetical protein